MENLFCYDSSSQPFTEILAFFWFFVLLILHYNDFVFRFNSLCCLETVKFFIHNDFKRRVSWCHFAEIMLFSNEEEAVNKNGFLEGRWNAYETCKEQQKVGMEFPSTDF